MLSFLLAFLESQAHHHPYRTLSISLALVPLLYILLNEIVRKRARLPSFNGPPGLPLIGNIADIKYNAAEKYREWSKTYGDVYQIQLGNIPVVVVNSAQSARVIFGQNSQALSSRPVFYTFHKVRTAYTLSAIRNSSSPKSLTLPRRSEKYSDEKPRSSPTPPAQQSAPRPSATL